LVPIRDWKDGVMLSSRTIYSLAQYLGLQSQDFAGTLLTKHGLNGWAVQITTQVLSDTVTALQAGSEDQITGLLDEIARTPGDLRSRVNPKYRYDERFEDLRRCLQLDGYQCGDTGLILIDPSVMDVPSLEDDLKRELSNSGLSEVDQVIQKLDDSANAFRGVKPNYNACLNDARVVLQTLATSIAQARVAAHPGSFDVMKWGSIIEYLRASGFITIEEERGLTGVFGFVSPGSHRPLGLSDQEIARLGRSFVSGMCWFLVSNFSPI
jgi:hypothetical protein